MSQNVVATRDRIVEFQIDSSGLSGINQLKHRLSLADECVLGAIMVLDLHGNGSAWASTSINSRVTRNRGRFGNGCLYRPREGGILRESRRRDRNRLRPEHRWPSLQIRIFARPGEVGCRATAGEPRRRSQAGGRVMWSPRLHGHQELCSCPFGGRRLHLTTNSERDPAPDLSDDARSASRNLTGNFGSR